MGEVKTGEVDGAVDVSYMKLKSIATADIEEHDWRFWIWPAKEDVLSIEPEYVLPVRPNIVVAKPPYTKRLLMFSVENTEVVDTFIE